MVLIMTMTPLHMTDHGHDLGAVGHRDQRPHVRDVRALAALGPPDRPVRQPARDRWPGSRSSPFAAVLAAVAPPEGGVLLFVALFLLGYGWNLGYVAGSALLTDGLSASPSGPGVQGLTDALIWSSAAAASLGSGVVVAAAGYATLGPAGRGAGRRPGLAAAVAAGAAAAAPRRAPAAQARPSSSHDPRGQHAGARLDLVERHVLVGAVGDPHVARAEDHARRAALVDEQPHVRAVGLAEQRRAGGR